MSPSPRFAELAALCRQSPPLAVLVLGSGMGPIARRVQHSFSVPFGDIPGLPAASVHGHKGCLTLGDWAGQRVLVYEGRVHYYEGHSWETVVAPMQTAATLGVKIAVLTNAAGGITDDLGPGTLMALRDHILCNRPYWWQKPGPGGVGSARPSPYSPRLLAALDQSARALDTQLSQGVYAALTGPCYETPAEIRAYRAWGADAVGMSTAREIEAAHAAGLECAAISLITNRAAGLSEMTLNHEEVLATAAATAQRLGDLLEHFLHEFKSEWTNLS
jgi:purine-nucleoside phosphorylase